jgi:D-alanine transfer protein
MPAPRSLLLEHASAAAIAAGLLWAAAPGLHAPEPPQAATRLAHPLQGYLANLSTEPWLCALLGQSLRDGGSIILFGSSELTSEEHAAKPVNFFNNQLQVPLLAIGHAGNQCRSIHAQLIAADAPLAASRIAILLSPGWFLGRSAERGTELAAFLEYQPSPALYRIAARAEAGDTAIAPVTDYLVEHAHELGAAQPVVKWLLRDARAFDRWRYCFAQPWDRWRIAASAGPLLADPPLRPGLVQWRMPPADSLPWQQLFARARAEHLAACTSNRVFVNDQYYAAYVQGGTKTVDIVPPARSRELRDLRRLLDYLKQQGADPLFVLQPLNPYVYTNLADADATIDEVRGLVKGHGFALLDLWRSDTARFEPGVLTDVMHLGALGWYKVDSALVAHFREP